LLASESVPTIPPQPPVQLLDRQPVPGGQRVHLRIARSGKGDQFRLLVDTTVAVSDVVINGRALEGGGDDQYLPRYVRGARGEVLHYYGVPPEGVDLWLTLASKGAVSLRIVTAVEGLPETATGPLPPRPVTMMSKPFVPTDMTITGWTIPL
jgi:hypothetical protein